MKLIYSILILAVLSCTADRVNASETLPDKNPDQVEMTVPEDMDVYLLIGQSNAAGRGKIQPQDEVPMDGIWLYDSKSGKPEEAFQPLNIFSTVRKGVHIQGFNFAGPFAAKIHKETGRPVLLIVNARGATMQSAWMKGGPQLVYSEKDGDDKYLWGQQIPQLYDEAVRITKEALRFGRLKGILWHQGCGNSNEANSKTYLSQLNKMVQNLRNDLDCPDVPFVAGQLLPEFKNARYFNPMIMTIGDVISNGFCASSEGCTSIGDATHFNRESEIILGERYADIILKEVYNK